MSQEPQYEIERILDHVSFLDAYEMFFKNGEQRYSIIFSADRFPSKKKIHSVCKYFFLVKWLGYDRQNLTWEPESSIPDGVYLAEYKKLNNLTVSHIIMRVTLPLKTKREGYKDPVICGENVMRRTRLSFEQMDDLTMHLNDEVNNGKFGMVPICEFKRKKQKSIEYLKKGSEIYLLKKVDIPEPSGSKTRKVVANYHRKDRSFLQGLISHKNIVRMLDSFVSSNSKNEIVTIYSIHTWCQHSLREKVNLQNSVDWKHVCRDILNAFSFIHPYGIHQAVSLDTIYYHTSGIFKLSHFNDFVFGHHIEVDNAKSKGIEFAARKYGHFDDFDACVDIYALAIVLLQCHMKKSLFRLSPISVIEIEEDIEKAMTTLENDDDRHFLRMMLRGRRYSHSGAGNFRFSSFSLKKHPFLQNSTSMKSVECFFLQSMLACPIKDRVFYEDDDTVEEVITRHVSLYHNLEKTSCPKYLMIVDDSFATRKGAFLIDDQERFFEVVQEDVMNERKQLLIFPVINRVVDSQEKTEKSMVVYPQELGGCPIVIEAPKMEEIEFAKMVKRETVGTAYRKLRVDMYPRTTSKQSGGKKVKKFTPHEYLMELTEKDGIVIKNRFVTSEEMEMPLKDEMLDWGDVAGYMKNDEPDTQDVKPFKRKRPQMSDGSGSGNPKKRRNGKTESELPIDVLE